MAVVEAVQTVIFALPFPIGIVAKPTTGLHVVLKLILLHVNPFGSTGLTLLQVRVTVPL
jgi:hypothetical protein